MVRAAFIDNNGMIKGAWSEEEDNKLRAYVLRYGHFNWRLVPKYAGLNRCGKSCRLRWVNYLKPDVRRGNFTREEGELIKKLHDELGNRWSAIAARFPGRTDNEIKNYWHTHFNKRNRKGSKNSQVKSSQTATHLTNSSESYYSDLKQEKSECSDVFIFDSSASSSISGVSEGAVGADWDLESMVDKNWSPEMLSEPSDYLAASCWGGSDGDGSCSADSFSGMFQESFVVDTSYIQEIDFPLFDDCGAYFNQALGFDDGSDMKLF